MKEKKQKLSGNKILCRRCNKREGVINYAASIMDFTHGFSEHICRQCYIKILENTFNNAKKELNKQKKLLKKDGNKR
jgi:hypothetical protein